MAHELGTKSGQSISSPCLVILLLLLLSSFFLLSLTTNLEKLFSAFKESNNEKGLTNISLRLRRIKKVSQRFLNTNKYTTNPCFYHETVNYSHFKEKETENIKIRFAKHFFSFFVSSLQ